MRLVAWQFTVGVACFIAFERWVLGETI